MMEKNEYQHQVENEHSSLMNKIQRDSESMDDFEHVEHVTPLSSHVANLEDDFNAASSKLVNVQSAPMQQIGNIGKVEDTLSEFSGLRSSSETIPQQVSVTQPSFLDTEKFGSTILTNAPSSDALIALQDQVFPANSSTVKGVTMDFIHTEKSNSSDQFSPQLEMESCKFGDSSNTNGDKKTHESVIQKGSQQHNISPDLLCEGVGFPDKVHEGNFEFSDNLEQNYISNMTSNNENQVQKKSQNLSDGVFSDIKSTVLPAPEEAPIIDFLIDDASYNEKYVENKTTVEKYSDNDIWNLSESTAPMKPLPPVPTEFDSEQDDEEHLKFNEQAPSGIAKMPIKHEMLDNHRNISSGINDFCDLNSNPDPVPSSMKISQKPSVPHHAPLPETSNYFIRQTERKFEEEIAPRKIFSDIGLEAWFNPERLTPQVAALIYWRQPEKTAIVFAATVGVLLSLACFSLISVFSYLALLILVGTMSFRIYKTIMQAVQKTSDGHPFKDILEIDLTLPAEKVHEMADIAVAHANAAVSELRRLFLIEDFVDSLKFSIYLWALTYIGSWFNGMTLIIIGVIALFTLPKVYETNKSQIDHNLAMVQGKINDITAKVKAAIPLGKKAEPTKEE